MGMSLKFYTDGLVVRLLFVKYLNFQGIFSYTANQNIAVKKIPNFLGFLHCSFQMDGVDFVTIWSGGIPRLTKQTFMLVICCRQVIGICFLGCFLDLMLNTQQNTCRGMGSDGSGCSKQSTCGGPRCQAQGVLHAPGAANVAALGHPLPGSVWELGMRTPAPRCTEPNPAPLPGPSADVSSALSP